MSTMPYFSSAGMHLRCNGWRSPRAAAAGGGRIGSGEACEQNDRVVATMSDALKRRAMVGAHGRVCVCARAAASA